MTSSTDAIPEGLADLVRQLTERISSLESQVDNLKKQQRIPEDDLIVIAAAIAAYVGHKASIKAVRFNQGHGWTQAGRGRVHNRQVLHVR